MGNGSLSSSNNRNNTNHHAPITEPNRWLALDFQYSDQQRSIKIKNRVRFLPTDTIRMVAKQFLELDEQRVVSPEKVILVSVCLAGQCFTMPAQNDHMTLDELGIKNGSLLCFEPLSVRARPKLSHLTICSPNGKEKKDYEWDEQSTTLNMLLQYVIKLFSLNSIKCENIQLCTFSNENLNRSNNSGKKLSELGLINYSTIFVTITKLTSLYKYDQDIFVHVKSNFHDETLYASRMDTIAELENQIALRFNQSRPINFEWRNGKYEKLDVSNPKRKLEKLGIKSGETISVTFGASVTDMNPTDCSITNSKVDAPHRPSRSYQIDLKPLGLVNLGNTCFMNSALQCLFHIAPLNRFFLDGFARVHTDDDNHNSWNPFDTCGEMTGAYAELLWNMRRPNRNDSDSIYSFKPTRIKETISHFAPRFATSDQQDAQEFMTFVLDTIHEELEEKNKPDGNTIIKQLFFGTIKSRVTCLECHHVKTTTNRISFLPLPLTRQERKFKVNFLTKNDMHDCDFVIVPAGSRVGNLVQAFLERRYLSHLFNHIVAITTNSEGQLKFETPLSRLSEHEVTLIEQEDYTNRIRPDQFDKEPDNLRLEECLQEFVSLEQLDDLWFCQQSTCKRHTHATKQLQFNTLPLVLVIQLKRFSYTDAWRRKLDTFVDYPINGLNLSHFLPSSKQAIYDLIAVSNHIGSIYSGHYTACARQESKTDKWYKFDDSDVSTIDSQHEIVSRDAYLLFYIKRNK